MAQKPSSTARKTAPFADKQQRRPESGTVGGQPVQAPRRGPVGPLVLALPKPSRAPRVPAHLSPPMRRWWSQAVRDFVFEPHHLLILTAAARSHDLMVRARGVIDRDGMTFLDRWNQPKVRAEVQVEHNAKIAFARLLRELALDVSMPDEARPPGLGAGRRRS